MSQRITGTRKPFDEELAGKCDLPGREKVCRYLERIGYSPRMLPQGKFGPDIGLDDPRSDGRLIFVEVQMRSKEHWKEDGTFRYSSAHVPKRYLEGDTLKEKLIIVLVSPNLKRAVIIPGFECTEERLVEVPNKYVAEGEEFYDVPLAKCDEIDLDARKKEGRRQKVADIFEAEDEPPVAD